MVYKFLLQLALKPHLQIIVSSNWLIPQLSRHKFFYFPSCEILYGAQMFFPGFYLLLLKYKNIEPIARRILTKIKSDFVLSIKRATVPIIATPPSQTANELIQQQLVPIIKVIMLPINVFL